VEKLYEVLKAAAEEYGFDKAPSLRTLYGWSSRYRWGDRIVALERKARAIDEEEQVEAIREMNRRHSKEAVAVQQKALQRLQSMDPDEMKPGDVLRAIWTGVRIERLSRGEATERVESEAEIGVKGVDLSRLTEDELRELLRFARQQALKGDEHEERGDDNG
jgi:hypothetical protein